MVLLNSESWIVQYRPARQDMPPGATQNTKHIRNKRNFIPVIIILMKIVIIILMKMEGRSIIIILIMIMLQNFLQSIYFYTHNLGLIQTLTGTASFWSRR